MLFRSFQLQCIIRIFSVVYKNIALFDTVFSYFHYFQIESVEHKSFVFVGTENHRFAVFEEYGVFGSCLFRRYGRMSTIIEYHTGSGYIINLGSVAGTYSYPGGNVYGATKAYVRQFSLNLRADLAGTGVRVSNIEPDRVPAR